MSRRVLRSVEGVAALAIVAAWLYLSGLAIYLLSHVLGHVPEETMSTVALVVSTAMLASPSGAAFGFGGLLASVLLARRHASADARTRAELLRGTALLVGLTVVVVLVATLVFAFGSGLPPSEARALLLEAWSLGLIEHAYGPFYSAPVAVALVAALLAAASSWLQGRRSVSVLAWPALALPLLGLLQHLAGLQGRLHLCDATLAARPTLWLDLLMLPALLTPAWLVTRSDDSPSYRRLHRSRRNLAIHLVAVPLAWLGVALTMLRGVAPLLATDPPAAGAWLGLSLLAVSFGLQAWGHRREPTAPEPFAGPADFLRRLATEQFWTFPRFVLGGHWWRAWRARS